MNKHIRIGRRVLAGIMALVLVSQVGIFDTVKAEENEAADVASALN